MNFNPPNDWRPDSGDRLTVAEVKMSMNSGWNSPWAITPSRTGYRDEFRKATFLGRITWSDQKTGRDIWSRVDRISLNKIELAFTKHVQTRCGRCTGEVFLMGRGSILRTSKFIRRPQSIKQISVVVMPPPFKQEYRCDHPFDFPSKIWEISPINRSEFSGKRTEKTDGQGIQCRVD